MNFFIDEILLWYRARGKELQSVSQSELIYITFVLYVLYIVNDLQILTLQ